ncbi:DNA-binding SARP family transcriptional activator [Kibdelosporangium banguiense]|uniref:DNA-binding SARP family transcriptional activator n=1 Tax=Kibdelosporangium banguiense TaxID=1365924 RepID=A0ABS4TH49_9PSEU|nr:BTAD domain-containing putative transcriptional regulator [Kibdelosporangium banguiense]MBP2323156.1 DNA-binding SARP family transcriptional activator [Kibdelosporangium banguiense]
MNSHRLDREDPAGFPRLLILGPLRVWRDGAELDAGPRQQAYLLALLLARVGRPVTTSELIGLIWGDDVPTSALNVIHKYVGALRRLLEPMNPARGAGSYLHRRGNAYLFSAGSDTLDLVAFRELVEAAKAALAQRHHEAALDHYVEALSLWQGPAGDGFTHGTTAMAIFTALDDEFHAACEAAADLAVSLRRPERVLPALQLAAKMAPFHEPVQASLISILGATGRQAEALSTFRMLQGRLADELGIAPGPALQDAYLRVLTQTPASALKPAPARRTSGLVGRAEELAVLRQAMEAAFTGRTGLGIVEGEPGVGKTRILQEAAADANQRGALVVWASCLEGDGAPSMWPWEQALTTVLDSLPAPAREKWLGGELGGLIEARNDHAAPAASGSRAQFRLFEQVVTVIGQAASQRPMLLIIDDLQWADTASLQLFGHLATRLPASSAIIGALRDRAPTPGSEFSRVLAAASRQPGHRRIRLGPLSLTDVIELVRRETGHEPSADIARTIHARTAGNPFFVRELSRLLSDSGALSDSADASAGVPSTVRDVVRDRMAGLDDNARDVLRIAALIGRDVELGLLARAADIDVTECLERLEPLRALGLLEPTAADPFSLRFAHDLVRESISETTAQQQAIRLHLRIADALEERHADHESITERLAYHLQAAGPLADPVRTAEALKRAGRRASVKLAFATADRHLQSAAQIARTAGLPELELSALSLLAIAPRRQAGYGGTTFDLLERAEHLARQLGREVEAAGLLFARLFGAYTFLEWDRERLVRRLYEQGEASSDPVVRVYGRQAWGLHQWDIGNIGEAYRCFEANNPAVLDGVVSSHSETPIRRDVSGEWPGWRAVVTALHGDVETARTMIDEWNGPDDPYAVATWAYYLTIIGSMAGDAGLVIRTIERWIAVGTGRAAVQQEHYVRLNWFWARALTGDDPAGIAAEADQLLAATLVDPPRWGVAYHYGLIAEMWLAAGMTDNAGVAIERADKALEANGQRYAEGLVRLLRARLLQARGEPVDVVRAAAEEARAWSTDREAHLFARRAQEFLAELDLS